MWRLIPMAWILLFVCGCGASVHTDNRAVLALPPAKVTTTTTVTKKIDQPVPVYQIHSRIETQTVTTPGSAPLHDAKVIEQK